MLSQTHTNESIPFLPKVHSQFIGEKDILTNGAGTTEYTYEWIQIKELQAIFSFNTKYLFKIEHKNNQENVKTKRS